MEGEAGILEEGVEAAAVRRRRNQTLERVGSEQRETQKATATHACTASTRARRRGGKLPPNAATAAPNSARISAHRSIEPS